MKVYGCYNDESYRSSPPLILGKGSRLAIEVSIAWTEGYSRKEKDTQFTVLVRSGCYMLHIKANNGDYLSKDKANELVRRIATEEIVSLDDEGVAFFDVRCV